MSDQTKEIGWQYYNHAAIPTCAPHEEPDLEPIKNGTVWHIDGGTPLFATWTTNFDCGYETEWWYIVKEAPFNENDLDPKVRKHIRQSFKKLTVELINPCEYADELCAVHNKTVASYNMFKGGIYTPDMFKSNDDKIDFWVAFSIDTHQIVGYMRCRKRDGYVETLTAKYDPEQLNMRASDAIHYTVLNYYLNKLNYSYVSSGSRNINHKTNAQDYKIKTFGFKKAYCKLNIAYNPKFKICFSILWIFKDLVKHLDHISIVHKINSALLLKKIANDCNRK